jgi:hypothetical protein
MKNTMAGWIAIGLLVASTGSLLAHHSLARYDTTAAVRVKGVVVRFDEVNPHTILFLDEKRADGRIHRWAVEGPAVMQLRRLHGDLFRQDLATQPFKVGDIVEACGYATKDGEKTQRSVSSGSTTISGQLMDGEQIVLPNGDKRTWSNYGVHKCLVGGPGNPPA